MIEFTIKTPCEFYNSLETNPIIGGIKFTYQGPGATSIGSKISLHKFGVLYYDGESANYSARSINNSFGLIDIHINGSSKSLLLKDILFQEFEEYA